MILSQNRVEIDASSADRTGSCLLDESIFTAVSISHPAVTYC